MFFPAHRPQQLSLGPLEREILNILWDTGSPSAKEILDRILQDPDRELAITSVTTVLQRLSQKGWVSRHKRDRIFRWEAKVSRSQAQVLQSHDRLQEFLAVSNPDTITAFADHLDQSSVEHLERLTERLKAARAQRANRPPGEDSPCT
ncbi:BlaI/MecI/CopY family transcriptional regulator [Prochlorothrix hollandica]|uniref:CopY family transcriptional regulator n=1 Tax=Prochlorothrix hollandica PCC 9006 = CALU 1027 TaxID=317619 RepID=A0A0M2PU25_PROHO|nr:BlaI/MecI/CopY family transcriptional regulator [Prochlorothrix hollandica]KKI98632.1 CopY family transcriptional regulator [Prochlorothrix hollandica PCC 9006 = CALU 1027]